MQGTRCALRVRFPLAGVPLATLLIAAGCTGAVGGNESGSGQGSGGSSTGGGSASGGSSGSGSGGSNAGSGSGGSLGGGTGGSVTPGTGGSVGISTDACPTTQVTPTPLRRLTKFEYANTVKNLLNVDPAPAADLPADEVTDGFSNNAGILTVSSLHAEKYVLVSEALAKEAVANLSALTTCDTAARGESACALDFARTFGRRAFRRPTTANDESTLMAAYTAGRDGGSFAEGIEVMIRAALQSPNFLYRLETTTPANAGDALVPLSSYELATRLSYLIWASGPDDALLDAAGNGKLTSKADVAAKARDMLKDAKARPAVAEFFNQWVGTSRLETMTKSSTLFPSYSSTVRDGMMLELPAFTSYVMWSGDHRLSTYLTSPAAFVTPALAKIYGVSAPSGATASAPAMAMLPSAQNRSGVLTQAGFLAAQAHPDQTSPVLRGKFVRTKLLCQPPPPPPNDANISVPDVTSADTARERFGAHLTAASSCMSCHQLMDPIGLAFENFDAIGTYRETENGKTIDASGSIIGTTDAALAGDFTGVKELGAKLASSDLVRDCVATQWFRYASGRNEEVPDACSLATLQKTFADSGGDLTEMVVGMTQTDAFWYRAPVTP